jgi:UDP-N-acetyl-D-glucosamine dehydrogenase
LLPSVRHYPHLKMASQELTADYLRSQDCVIIVTDHSAYDWAWIVEHSPLVIDTRNATRHVRDDRLNIVLS